MYGVFAQISPSSFGPQRFPVSGSSIFTVTCGQTIPRLLIENPADIIPNKKKLMAYDIFVLYLNNSAKLHVQLILPDSLWAYMFPMPIRLWNFFFKISTQLGGTDDPEGRSILTESNSAGSTLSKMSNSANCTIL